MGLTFTQSVLFRSLARFTRDRRRRSRWRRRVPAIAACVERLEPRSLLSAAPLSVAVSGQWIAVLHAGVDPYDFAEELRSSGREVLHVYAHAVSAVAFRGDAVAQDPRLAALEPDLMFETTAQVLPTGVDRIDADGHVLARIDGIDQRVNVDIAILDTGIDRNHPDLNVHAGRNFTSDNPLDWDDRNGHGTHVAGTAAALDNNFGVVGVAPGARLWGVKVLGDGGTGFLSDVVAGIDWVTARADQIEVANISMTGIGTNSLLHAAIRRSVAAGIVYVVAAGNDGQDVYGADRVYGTADDVLLASYPEVLTVSALADSDGRPGGLGGATSSGGDDSFASFSNFSTTVIAGNPVVSPGAAIDLMMPGVQILSTYRDGQYAVMSGTSMAAPHAAGMAAVYIAHHGRDRNGDGAYTAADVYAIRQALITRADFQASPRGLSTLNDGDGRREKIGWAGSYTASPAPLPQENPGDLEPARPVSEGRHDDDVDPYPEPDGAVREGRSDDDLDLQTAAEVRSADSLTAARPGALSAAGFDLSVWPEPAGARAAQAAAGTIEVLIGGTGRRSYDWAAPAADREADSGIPIGATPPPSAIHTEPAHAWKLRPVAAAGPAAESTLDAVFADGWLADELLSIQRMADLLDALPAQVI